MGKSRMVTILGAGSGGIVAATILRKRLPRSDRIIVIDKARDHLFAPSLLWVMIGDRKPEKISKPIKNLERKGIEVIQGNVSSIDPNQLTVTVAGETIVSDALIVALGADYVPQNIPGLSESGLNAYSLQGATEIRDALNHFKQGKIVILTASPVYKCPAAPYEMAMLIEYQCRRLKIRNHVQMDVFASEPGPMGTAGPEVSKQVRQMVENKGITYHASHQVTAVDSDKRIISFSNGSVAPFDLLIYVPPHQAPQVVQESGLLSESGWIAVDRHTLETKFKNVYAIGDVTSIPLKMGKPLPKAGIFAHGQAKVVAHNIARQWTGQGSLDSFQGEGTCFIETGDKRAGIGTGNFYSEPSPQIIVKKPGLKWHLGKVLFEKYWFWKWF